MAIIWRVLTFSLLCIIGSTAVAQEPGLEGRDDVLLQTSFEDDAWFESWGRSEAPRNAEIVRDGTSFRGEGHLRVTVPRDSHYGTSFGFQFAEQGLEEPDEIYFRYAIRLGSTWTTEGGGGGKFPGFGGTYGVAGWGGRPSDGTNGWSSRMLFWQPESGRADGDTRIGYYVYHADMPGTYGDNWFWSGGPIGEGGALERDRWYQIEAYVRLNTPGENDGILRGWVDGVQVFDRGDVRFRDVDDLRLERVWFDLYYGGNWTAPTDMWVDFDNAVIAREPIGPVDDEPTSPGDMDGGLADLGGGADAGSGPTSDGGDESTPTPADGGTAGSPHDTGEEASSATNETDGGCCATAHASPTRLIGALLLLLGTLLTRRRSRR